MSFITYTLTYQSMVACQKGPTRHAYAWQIGPFWQDTLAKWDTTLRSAGTYVYMHELTASSLVQIKARSLLSIKPWLEPLWCIANWTLEKKKLVSEWLNLTAFLGPAKTTWSEIWIKIHQLVSERLNLTAFLGTAEKEKGWLTEVGHNSWWHMKCAQVSEWVI